MDENLFDVLSNVGYEGPFLDKSLASSSVVKGLSSDELQDLVIWLTEEIRGLGKLDEKITKSVDVSTFILELTGFLKELMCPYVSLTSGHVSDRFRTPASISLLLEFLTTELMSFKMCTGLKPKDKTNVITLNETPTASALKDISVTLGLGKPPGNIPVKILFEKINVRLDETLKVAGIKRIGSALFVPQKSLTMDQWSRLEKLQQDLDVEYDLRRKMLLTRLDVTIQSFKWSLKVRGKEGEISEKYGVKRNILDTFQTGGKNTDMAAFLAARDTLAIIEKTSSASVRKNTKSKIQRHIMGRVPDRGGRANEHQPPPPEMPPWQTRAAGGGGGGGFGGRGGGGGDRGGRGRGGGFNNQQQSSRGGFDNRGGGGGGQQQNFQGQNRGGNSRVQGGWAPQKDFNQGNQGFSNNSGSGGRGGYNNNQQQSYGNSGGFSNNPQSFPAGGGFSNNPHSFVAVSGFSNNSIGLTGGGGFSNNPQQSFGARSDSFSNNQSQSYRGGRGGFSNSFDSNNSNNNRGGSNGSFNGGTSSYSRGGRR